MIDKRYPHYKPTGAAWLGDVPSHWNLERLGLHFHERRTKVSDKDYPPLSVTKNGVVPQLETAAKTDDGDNRKLVKNGDFVINGRSDRKGSSGLSNLDGSVSLINIVLRPEASVYPDFCHYLLRSTAFQEEFYRMGNGLVADLWTTHFSDMKNIRIALPPIDEQCDIAAFLVRETTRIDSLIDKKTRFIELLKEKRQAVIAKAVTKGLEPAVPMKDSGVKWLGNVPTHWHVAPLKHYLDRNDGGVWGDEPTADTDTIVLRSTEQAVDGSWQIIDPARRKLSSSEISKSLLKEGDLLVTKSSGSEQHIGKTSLVTSEVAALQACYSNFMQRLRVSKNTTPEFVALILNNRIAREQMAYQSNSTTGLANLTAGMIGEVKFCFPPLQEQRSLIGKIKESTARLDSLSEKTERSIELLKEHRSALITAAVTGKIDVRKSK